MAQDSGNQSGMGKMAMMAAGLGIAVAVVAGAAFAVVYFTSDEGGSGPKKPELGLAGRGWGNPYDPGYERPLREPYPPHPPYPGPCGRRYEDFPRYYSKYKAGSEKKDMRSSSAASGGHPSTRYTEKMQTAEQVKETMTTGTEMNGPEGNLSSLQPPLYTKPPYLKPPPYTKPPNIPEGRIMKGIGFWPNITQTPVIIIIFGVALRMIAGELISLLFCLVDCLHRLQDTRDRSYTHPVAHHHRGAQLRPEQDWNL